MAHHLWTQEETRGELLAAVTHLKVHESPFGLSPCSVKSLSAASQTPKMWLSSHVGLCFVEDVDLAFTPSRLFVSLQLSPAHMNTVIKDTFNMTLSDPLGPGGSCQRPPALRGPPEPLAPSPPAPSSTPAPLRALDGSKVTGERQPMKRAITRLQDFIFYSVGTRFFMNIYGFMYNT